MREIENRLLSEVFGGQKQRVAIAKAFYTQPFIILVDESTASLDTENAMAVIKILKEQSKECRKICIIVMHWDKVFHMQDGWLLNTKIKIPS